MINWEVLLVNVVLILASCIVGIFIGKRQKRPVALLVIDPVNPEVNGGVYTVWDDDPHEMVRRHELKDRQLIVMEVAIDDLLKNSQ